MAAKKCPACDATIAADASVCGNCGSEIQGDRAIPGGDALLRKVAREESERVFEERKAKDVPPVANVQFSRHWSDDFIEGMEA